MLQIPVALFLMIFKWIVVHLQEKRAYAFGTLIIVPLFRLRRNHIMKRMNIVFSDKDQDDGRIAKIYTAHLYHISDTIVELTRLPHCSTDNLDGKVEIEGINHLHDALQQGKGALLVGTHMGNWSYTRVQLAMLGFPVSNVFNRIPVPIIDRQMQAIQQKFGIRTVYVGEGGSRAAEEAFKNNQVFSVLFDISVPGRENQSTWLPLGNALMFIDLGPALLALKHQVPVIRTSMISKGNHRYTLIFHEPSTYHSSSNILLEAEQVTTSWLNDFTTELFEQPERWWQWGSVDLRESGKTDHSRTVAP